MKRDKKPMNSFKAAHVALLEARMSREIADMIRRYGGEPYCAPAVREASLECEEQVSLFIDHLTHSVLQAVVFFSQIQARHLFLIAADTVSPTELAQALNTQTVVASVGPTCTAVLRDLGVTPHVEPEHPKIGYLIKALVEYMK